jgi:hypothetical protein
VYGRWKGCHGDFADLYVEGFFQNEFVFGVDKCELINVGLYVL